MFLNQLTVIEKEAFISFSIHAANANGAFVEEEKAMVREYCKEMEIPYPDEEKVMTMEEVIRVFSQSNDQNKKVILFEIFGLIYSDGEYDSEEKKFINEYAKRIGLTDEDIEKQEKLIIRYLELLKEIVKAVS